MVLSVLFYAYGEMFYVLLMILSSIINYAGALLIDKGQKKKLFLGLTVIIDLGILCVFKYTGFIIETLNSFISYGFHVPEIALPIGISFFTFQALSYVVDVYRGEVEVQKNYGNVLLYISFFPQLIAGPIVKYHDINKQIADREETSELTAKGFRRFIVGLSKKVLIANTMGGIADIIFNMTAASINLPLAWLGAVAYAFQIFYDFSGYSDMAIGLGWIFGFRIKENFLHPYGASSIKDFWRKWHVSLSTWFKDYVYIPLGGNRKGKGRTVINKFIVFFLTGLWHGAAWTFVLWGLYHGAFLMLEEVIPALQKLPKLIGNIYSLIVVVVGFVIFRAESIGQAGMMIAKMFTGMGANAEAATTISYLLNPWNVCILIVAFLFMAPVQSVLSKTNIKENGIVDKLTYVVVIVLFAWCMLRLSASTYNPFIYFRFQKGGYI